MSTIFSVSEISLPDFSEIDAAVEAERKIFDAETQAYNDAGNELEKANAVLATIDNKIPALEMEVNLTGSEKLLALLGQLKTARENVLAVTNACLAVQRAFEKKHPKKFVAPTFTQAPTQVAEKKPAMKVPQSVEDAQPMLAGIEKKYGVTAASLARQCPSYTSEETRAGKLAIIVNFVTDYVRYSDASKDNEISINDAMALALVIKDLRSKYWAAKNAKAQVADEPKVDSATNADAEAAVVKMEFEAQEQKRAEEKAATKRRHAEEKAAKKAAAAAVAEGEIDLVVEKHMPKFGGNVRHQEEEEVELGIAPIEKKNARKSRK